MSRIIWAFMVVCLTPLSCQRETPPAHPSLPSEEKDTIAFSLLVRDIEEDSAGTLRATLLLVNSSDTAVMIEVDGGGIGYATSVPVKNSKGFEWEDWLKVKSLAGSTLYASSNSAHRYILVDAGDTQRRGWVVSSAMYNERVVLAEKEPYGRLKEISHRIGTPIKVQVGVYFCYLQSCLPVRSAKAGVIRDGDWVACKVETLVDLPSSVRRGPEPSEK